MGERGVMLALACDRRGVHFVGEMYIKLKGEDAAAVAAISNASIGAKQVSVACLLRNYTSYTIQRFSASNA
jgi:hypothetical protein